MFHSKNSIDPVMSVLGHSDSATVTVTLALTVASAVEIPNASSGYNRKEVGEMWDVNHAITVKESLRQISKTRVINIPGIMETAKLIFINRATIWSGDIGWELVNEKYKTVDKKWNYLFALFNSMPDVLRNRHLNRNDIEKVISVHREQQDSHSASIDECRMVLRDYASVYTLIENKNNDALDGTDLPQKLVKAYYLKDAIPENVQINLTEVLTYVGRIEWR